MAITHPSILIMMASYNGEKYIREQIESIRSQTYHNWKMIVQDDGSTDRTIEIINEYANLDARIRLWIRPKEARHGAYYNFHSLINKVRETEPVYNYYMFSDHDDVWHESKIEVLIKAAEKEDESVPLLLYADMQVIDGTGSVKIPSMNASVGIKYNNNYSPFYCHSVSGCNIMINHRLFELAPAVDADSEICSIISHDNYFAKLAALTGKMVFIDKVLMSYRRYGENVTAKQEYNYGIKRILRRISGLDDLAKDHALTYNQTLYAINRFRKVSSSKNVNALLNAIEASLKAGGMNALRTVNRLNITWGNRVRTFSRKIVLAFGLYKKYLRKDV